MLDAPEYDSMSDQVGRVFDSKGRKTFAKRALWIQDGENIVSVLVARRAKSENFRDAKTVGAVVAYGTATDGVGYEGTV